MISWISSILYLSFLENEVKAMMRMAEVMLIAGAAAVGFEMGSDPKMKRKMQKMRRQFKRKLSF